MSDTLNKEITRLSRALKDARSREEVLDIQEQLDELREEKKRGELEHQNLMRRLRYHAMTKEERKIKNKRSRSTQRVMTEEEREAAKLRNKRRTITEEQREAEKLRKREYDRAYYQRSKSEATMDPDQLRFAKMLRASRKYSLWDAVYKL